MSPPDPREFIFACECGAAFKYYPSMQEYLFAGDIVQIKKIAEYHKSLGHEQVTCFEARTIRETTRRRKRLAAK